MDSRRDFLKAPALPCLLALESLQKGKPPAWVAHGRARRPSVPHTGFLDDDF